MCARFKSKGITRKPGDEIILETPEGEVTGVWTSFAQEEKIDWWIRRAGNTLAQCPVDEIAERADDTRELRWSKAPAGANLLFVVSPEIPGKIKPYRPARSSPASPPLRNSTTSATPASRISAKSFPPVKSSPPSLPPPSRFLRTGPSRPSFFFG